MVFPDLDVVAVTTGRDNYPSSKLAGYIANSVKSDTALPPDAPGCESADKQSTRCLNREADQSRRDPRDGGYHLRKGVRVSSQCNGPEVAIADFD
jgi:hypothetical protein